jgi:hypothetical protein
MNQGKVVAIITGAISILLAVAYLVLVQLLDFRGEMLPAPTLEVLQPPAINPISCIPMKTAINSYTSV